MKFNREIREPELLLGEQFSGVRKIVKGMIVKGMGLVCSLFP
jgi:hypothetical protein